MRPQITSVIILSTLTAIFGFFSLGFYYELKKPSFGDLKKYPNSALILVPGIASILTLIGLVVCATICINNAGGCGYCGNCVTGPASPASDGAPTAPTGPTGPAAPAAGAGPAGTSGPVGPVETGPFSTAEMYSSKIGSVTSLLGGTNIYAANGGQRTILTNAAKTYVYPLSADGFGGGVTTGRYMSFSLFLAGVPEDVGGIVSAVYMVPIPPISATGSTMKYGVNGSGKALVNANDNDKYGVAMGALYNDGQGIGYVTEDGYYANSGRTEIDLIETSKDSCQTTHHGFYGAYYNSINEKNDQFLPSRLGNTGGEARGDGSFPNYIIQENMPSTSTTTTVLGNASTGDNYNFKAVDGTIDPNGIWNNPYTISAANGIQYFNNNWGYGVGKYIDTTSQKGVQYDYYIKPTLVTDPSITPTSENLNDYWSDVQDPDTQTWYTLQIYYRIVQEQSDGSVNVLPNQAYYDALAAVDNSQVSSFIVNFDEAGDGLWFLVDSSPSQDFSDAYGIPRAPTFYSGYDLKYMILTQSYWTPSLIGEAGAGPTIWLDGNEDTSSPEKCSADELGQSKCGTGHNVDCTVCRGPNLASSSQVIESINLEDRCTSVQQTTNSSYYTSQQVQNVIACQGAPADPVIGNMTVFAEDGVVVTPSADSNNCCSSIGYPDGLSTSQAATAGNNKSYYNIFYNLYMDIYLDDPRWTLDYQYRGVNTIKTAPAKYEVLQLNTENWRGGYGPQFGICNIESGWPGTNPVRGVDIVNLLDTADKDKPKTDLCTPFLKSIGELQPARNQQQTLKDLTNTYGKNQTTSAGYPAEITTKKQEWYQNICMPTDDIPKGDLPNGTVGSGVMFVDASAPSGAANAQYAMKVDCNFLPTKLQTSLP